MQRDLWEAYRDKSFLVVAINLGDKREEVKAFQERSHLTYPVLMDPDKSSSPRFKTDFAMPYNLLVDGQMVVRYSAAGSDFKLLKGEAARLLSAP